MDVILTDKISLQQQPSLGQKSSRSFHQESVLSPRIRYGIGANQFTSRNISSARPNRAANSITPLQQITSNNETPRAPANQLQLALKNPNLAVVDSNIEKNEDHQLRGAKHQPKISSNSHLPPVFLTDRSQPIKIK